MEADTRSPGYLSCEEADQLKVLVLSFHGIWPSHRTEQQQNKEFKAWIRVLDLGLRNLGIDTGIWDAQGGDETMSIPSILRSLKVRRDMGCVTPSATHSLPTPHPGLAQPVWALKSTRKCHFPFEEV